MSQSGTQLPHGIYIAWGVLGVIIVIVLVVRFVLRADEKAQAENAQRGFKAAAEDERRKAAERRATADRLAGFLAQQLAGHSRSSLRRTPDLDIIRGEFMRARAEYWDFPLPSPNIAAFSPCWQQQVTDQKRAHGRDMQVLITPGGKWAVMGTEMTTVITRGEGHEIDGVPWIVVSGGDIDEYQLRVLDGAIEAILTRWRPAALQAYRALREGGLNTTQPPGDAPPKSPNRRRARNPRDRRPPQ